MKMKWSNRHVILWFDSLRWWIPDVCSPVRLFSLCSILLVFSQAGRYRSHVLWRWLDESPEYALQVWSPLVSTANLYYTIVHLIANTTPCTVAYIEEGIEHLPKAKVSISLSVEDTIWETSSLHSSHLLLDGICWVFLLPCDIPNMSKGLYLNILYSFPRCECSIHGHLYSHKDALLLRCQTIKGQCSLSPVTQKLVLNDASTRVDSLRDGSGYSQTF